MVGMIAHCGTIPATLDELKAIPTPERTGTYSPLGHYDFIYNAHKFADNVLSTKGFELSSERYQVSKDGGRLFFVHSYKNGTTGIEMCAAGRNSLDKTMSICLAIGGVGRVMICDNLMVSGDIVVFRRHIGDIFSYLKEKLVLGFHDATDQWNNLKLDAERLQIAPANTPDAHHFFVQARQEKVLKPRIFDRAIEEWHSSSHSQKFGRDSAWSIYNAGTEALKHVPVGVTLQTHRRFHDFATSHFGIQEVRAEVSLGDGESTQQRSEERLLPAE